MYWVITADEIPAHRQMFGHRVRELRRQTGWTSQERFAHHVGVDRTYMSGIEQGRRNPSLTVILKLAEALEIDPGVLLAGLSLDDPSEETTR